MKTPSLSEAEYLRPAQASACFGISRRTLDAWIQSGAILSYAPKSPGKTRSKLRLVNVASLRTFIATDSQGTTEGAV